ncbi:hypothetical protein [Natrialba swarupiae]|nr:hypothetical protein [Natrialba swarupiae]
MHGTNSFSALEEDTDPVADVREQTFPADVETSSRPTTSSVSNEIPRR